MVTNRLLKWVGLTSAEQSRKEIVTYVSSPRGLGVPPPPKYDMACEGAGGASVGVLLYIPGAAHRQIWKQASFGQLKHNRFKTVFALPNITKQLKHIMNPA